MLYTAHISIWKKTKQKMKHYYLVQGQGNDSVIPDQRDYEQYQKGEVTWAGFKVNYTAKLMRKEADEWMRKVAKEAMSGDVVLISEEEDVERSYRILLADMMINMFSGQMNIQYRGELKPNVA